MPKFIDIVTGMNILAKHVNPEKDYAQAEHDELYLPGPAPETLGDDEVEKLKSLGFSWDDHNESWHVFT